MAKLLAMHETLLKNETIFKEPPMTHTKRVYYFNSKEAFAGYKFARTLSSFIEFYFHQSNEFVILCIGSDRVTGDSLGPLIGYKLSKYNTKKLHLYGTLDCPVHAINLEETVSKIETAHPHAPIIAIDASLGSRKYLGFVTLGLGKLHPGTGVHKDLPAVGDIFITGIVNTSGLLEQMALQTTRLSTVMKLADCITQGIASVLL